MSVTDPSTPVPHVLVAPDKFKGSLTAGQAADAIARGFAAVRPDVPVHRVPVADGGDGTVSAALAAGYRHGARLGTRIAEDWLR